MLTKTIKMETKLIILGDGEYKYYSSIRYKTYRILCHCGNEFQAIQSNFRQGEVLSCGCIKKSICHNLTNHPLHTVWGSMVSRCHNPNEKAYRNYGGRGIFVCDEWRKFKHFYDWAILNGFVRGLELDRINNDLGYSPYNCRFVTKQFNNRNKRTNHLIEYNGEIKTIAEWAEIHGINRYALRSRLVISKWPMAKAISQPIHMAKPKKPKKPKEKIEYPE